MFDEQVEAEGEQARGRAPARRAGCRPWTAKSGNSRDERDGTPSPSSPEERPRRRVELHRRCAAGAARTRGARTAPREPALAASRDARRRHASAARRPCGRIASTTTSTAKTMASERLRDPEDPDAPRRRRRASRRRTPPRIEPRPPITTTTKARMIDVDRHVRADGALQRRDGSRKAGEERRR